MAARAHAGIEAAADADIAGTETALMEFAQRSLLTKQNPSTALAMPLCSLPKTAPTMPEKTRGATTGCKVASSDEPNFHLEVYCIQ